MKRRHVDLAHYTFWGSLCSIERESPTPPLPHGAVPSPVTESASSRRPSPSSLRQSTVVHHHPPSSTVSVSNLQPPSFTAFHHLLLFLVEPPTTIFHRLPPSFTYLSSFSHLTRSDGTSLLGILRCLLQSFTSSSTRPPSAEASSRSTSFLDPPAPCLHRLFHTACLLITSVLHLVRSSTFPSSCLRRPSGENENCS
ncbi:hypothetical protein PIB30_006971 [Stylosanthes scabra]|uniref:Uncharacterized protein n=1 Tax=Stylosanthes scabra TaxID=79078 RepID=A0ABU6Y4J8_9FABA|nr:hypothetical protein [Stylosanthes scabra]